MELTVTPDRAWEIFFENVRRTDAWKDASRAERAYISKANTHYKAGALGYFRIRSILERYGEGRYQFCNTITITT